MRAKPRLPPRLRSALARIPLARRIGANPLVDAEWYRAHYEDVRDAGMDPAMHYRLFGRAESRNPNPLFDTAWYLARNPDVRDSGMDPLDHYLAHGGLEGRDPSPYFDSDWYLDAYPDVRQTGMNPLLHFLAYGQREGRLPRAFVDLDQPPPSVGIRGSSGLRRRLGVLLRGRRAWVGSEDSLQRPQLSDADRELVREALGGDALPAEAVVAISWASAEDVQSTLGDRGTAFPAYDMNPLPVLTSSTAAIAHLEWQRHGTTTHIAFPDSAEQWLQAMPDFGRYLERFRRVVLIDEIRVVELRRARTDEPPAAADRLQSLVSEFRDRELRDPVILDLWSGFDFRSAAPGVHVFLPPRSGRPPFAYLSSSVDLVGVAAGDEEMVTEARRIARHAVLLGSVPAGSGWAIEVEGKEFDLSARLPSISIVVPTHNGAQMVARCLAALDENLPAYLSTEVVVVDDHSDEPEAKLLAGLTSLRSNVRLVRTEKNLGFVGAVNLGASAAQGDLLVLLNDDTLPLAGWLSSLVRTFRQRPDAGAVGGRLLYPDGRLQEAGGIVFSDGSGANFGRDATDPDAPQFNYLREVDYVSGALLATPASVFRDLKGLDPIYGFGYYDDSDYAFKLRKAGLRAYFQPESVVIHVEGGTSGTDTAFGPKRHQVTNRQIFRDRWAVELAQQPDRPASASPGVMAAIADRAGR